MSNNLTHTGILTAGVFGMENAFCFNPVKGCNNESCHLHPANTRKCWAAEMCNRMAGPWAEYERNYLSEKFENEFPANFMYMHESTRDDIETEFAIKTTGHNYCLSQNEIIAKMKAFKPTWLESQYEKEFPKKRSCILVCYMTDIAFIPKEWVQKIIDKIYADNLERYNAGLPWHIFQFLTEDPSVYAKFKWPVNCWLGFTATNQKEYNERWQQMPEDQKNIQYAYIEPLREKIEIKNKYVDWVIVGGGPTPLHPDWVRSIMKQCQEAGIPFFFKSWGKWLSYWCPHDHVYKHTKAPKGILFNVLFGRTYEQFPEVPK